MELTIDAASQSARAGLSSHGAIQWTSGPLTPRQHTRELLPAIACGLNALSATFDSVKVIIVSVGPGPFNGLRVAVSIAKGLAAGTGAAVVGISTMQAEAFRCEPSAATVRPIVCAGRTGFTTALFAKQDMEWIQVENNLHVDVSEIESILSESVSICGDVDEVLAALPASSPKRAVRAAACCGSRLEILAKLGWKRYAGGDITSAATLQPLYARPPHITVARDRRP